MSIKGQTIEVALALCYLAFLTGISQQHPVLARTMHMGRAVWNQAPKYSLRLVARGDCEAINKYFGLRMFKEEWMARRQYENSTSELVVV